MYSIRWTVRRCADKHLVETEFPASLEPYLDALGTRASGPHGEYRARNHLSLLSLLPGRDRLGAYPKYPVAE
jgi:hypothetical protein